MLKKTLKSTAAITILFLSLSSARVLAAQTTKDEVISGKDRIHTAIQIAEKSWNEKWKDSHIAFLTSKENKNLIDALTVSPLAYKLKAPILLSSYDIIDDDTLKVLKNQKITKVYIVNGNGVISEDVANQLKSMNIEVERLGGENRYKTCENILNELKKNNVNLNNIVVVSDNGIADALSISSVASFCEMPIIFTDGKDKIASEFKDDVKNAEKVYAVGGSGVISDKLVSEIKAKRLGGENRYQTNEAVIDEFSKKDLNFDKVYLANGENDHLVDSLVGSVLAAQTKSPIVLGENQNSSGVNGIDGKTTEKTDFIQLGGDVNKSFVRKAEGKDIINDLKITDIITDTKGYINAQDVHSEYKVVISGIADPYAKIKLTVLDDKKDVTDKVAIENTTIADSDGDWILTLENLKDIKDGNVEIIVRDNKNRKVSSNLIKNTKLPDVNFTADSLSSKNILNYPINITVGKNDSLESVYVIGNGLKKEVEMKKDSDGKYSGNINLIRMENEGDIVLDVKAKTVSGSVLEKSLEISNDILYENIIKTAKTKNQVDMKDELNNYAESKACNDNYYKELTDKQKELASAIMINKINNLDKSYTKDDLYSDLNNASVEASCFKGAVYVEGKPYLAVNVNADSFFVKDKSGNFVPLSNDKLNSKNLSINGYPVKSIIYSSSKNTFLILLDSDKPLSAKNIAKYNSSNTIYCKNKSKTAKDFPEIKLESFTYTFQNDLPF